MKSNWSRRELEALGEPINPVLPTRLNRVAGGGGKGSAPPAPDYKGAAEAQGKSSIEAIREQTSQNRVNQNNPWGSLTWDKSGGFDQTGYDKAMQDYKNSWVAPTAGTSSGYWDNVYSNDDSGTSSRQWIDSGTSGSDGYYSLAEPDRNAFDGPTEWTQNVTLNPESQGALDSQIATQRGRSDIANGLMPSVEEAITKPLDWDSFQQMGAAPSASQFDRSTANPNFGSMGYNPNLNLGLNNTFDASPFSFNNAPKVGDLNRNGVPGMPTYDSDFVQNIQNQALGFMSADQNQQRSGLESRLAAQGVTQGSAAYDNAMRQFNDQQSRDKYQALNVAMSQGQGMFNSNLAANAQGFGQNRDIFNSQLAKNQNAFNQANQGFQNNFNLDNLKFNQELGRNNFTNNALTGQHAIQMGNTGFNNQVQKDTQQSEMARLAFNNSVQQDQFRQQQQIADYQNNMRIQQIQEAQMRQLQPLNNLNALLTGQQVGNPQFNSFNTAGAAQPTNYLGAAQAQGQYGMQAQAMNNASSNSMLGGAFQLGGQLGSAYMLGGGLG